MRAAAAVFGWGIVRERLDHSELGDGESPERRLPGAPIITLVRLTTPERDDAVSPALPDAWRVLQQVRRGVLRGRELVRRADGTVDAAESLRAAGVDRIGLDHILTIDPIGVNPFTKTNPVSYTHLTLPTKRIV